jgi:hypothetical protein
VSKIILMSALLFTVVSASAKDLVAPSLRKEICEEIRKSQKKTMPYCENGTVAIIRDSKVDDEYSGPNALYIANSDEVPRVQLLCYFDLKNMHQRHGVFKGSVDTTDCRETTLPLDI